MDRSFRDHAASRFTLRANRFTGHADPVTLM
jgi:hypothetical protein